MNELLLFTELCACCWHGVVLSCRFILWLLDWLATTFDSTEWDR